MCRWSRTHDKLLNRIAIVNQIHGCRYDYSVGNPCTVRYARGAYVCEYGGAELCAWGVYDLSSLDAAYAKVDALADALWLVRRAGFLRVSISC